MSHIDPSTIPSDYDSSSVLHMWMLGDYDHGSETGMKLSFTGTLDVEDGTVVDLLYINNEAHEWQSLGTFTVTAGDPDIKELELPVLSALKIVRTDG